MDTPNLFAATIFLTTAFLTFLLVVNRRKGDLVISITLLVLILIHIIVFNLIARMYEENSGMILTIFNTSFIIVLLTLNLFGEWLPSWKPIKESRIIAKSSKRNR